MEILWRVSQVVEWALFGVLLVLFVVILSPLLPTKNTLISFAVASGSMEPVIPKGAVVLVRPTPAELLLPGDVIAFSRPEDPETVILHRIYKTQSMGFDSAYITKGDANSAPDNWTVTSSMIRGQYILAIPYLGHAIVFLKTWLGFLVVIGIPALVLILFQILKIFSGIREILTQKEDQDNLEKSKSLRKNPALTLGFIAGFLSGLFWSDQALALFTDEVQVVGIKISVVDFVAPGVPELLSPDNHSIASEGEITFSWGVIIDPETPGESVTYDIRISTNHNFTKIIHEENGLTEPEIKIELLHGAYWWQVKVCDASGNCSDWSGQWKLTLVPKKDDKPKLEMIYQKTKSEIKFNLTQISQFKRLKYMLNYKTPDGEEGVAGETDISGSDLERTIYAGTCSDDGCIPHEILSPINLQINLIDTAGNQLDIESSTK
jgi:signal peptidase